MTYTEPEEFDLVIRQVRELIGIFREAIDRYDISENEFWIWYSLIALKQEVTQQDICSAWSLHKQTVNTIVSGMVRKGLATLTAIPGTRNHKRICLTEKGQKYGESIVFPVFEAEKRAFSRLPQEGRSAFLTFSGIYADLLRQEIQKG